MKSYSTKYRFYSQATHHYSTEFQYAKGKDSVPYWIAPERDPPKCNNDKGKSDDIWNFGICALEVLHGGSPLTSPLSQSLF